VTALTPGEQATLRSLAATFVPAADADRVATIASDALSRAVDPAQLTQLRLVLRLLEASLANLATGAGFAAFREMGSAARERTLLRWAGSPLVMRRSGINAFRKLLTFIAYADPGTADAPNPLPRALGYAADDPPLPKDLAAIRPLVVDRTPPSGGAAPIELEADVVVVGSGAGGGVVAAELAGAGRSVLVVESGPFVDEASMPRDELDAYARLYLNYGLLSTWDGAVTMLAGSGVGGGTLVNWMTCLDTQADIRGEWATEHGLDGVDGDEWVDDVREIEARLGVAPATVIPPKDELIRRGAAALGWDSEVIRRNATDCGDCGSCPFGCRRGTKQSGIRAHLADAASLGARVLDRARVRSIIRAGDATGRVIGVAGTLGPDAAKPDATRPDAATALGVDAPPRWFSVYARQVVLAAGALRSPAILQASGIDHNIDRAAPAHPPGADPRRAA
jgi:long-chain-alcohol oxidase